MTDIKVCFAGGVDFIQKGRDFLCNYEVNETKEQVKGGLMDKENGGLKNTIFCNKYNML